MDKTWYMRPSFIVMSAFVAWFATAAFYAVGLSEDRERAREARRPRRGPP